MEMSYDFTDIIKTIQKNKAIRDSKGSCEEVYGTQSLQKDYGWQLEHGWFEKIPEKDEYLPNVYGEA
jgi:hypothetical protein